MEMCREILRDGTCLVERPDAQFLRSIRDGEHSFEELEERYQALDEELAGMYQKSTLQNQPKRDAIEQLGIELVEQFLATRQ
jgi:hypothetical protein